MTDDAMDTYDNLPQPPAGSSIPLSEFFDGHPVATFAIDRDHMVTHWNKACEHLLSYMAGEMVGTHRHARAFYPDARPTLADLILDANAKALERYRPSPVIAGAYEAEEYFEELGESGHWLQITAAPLRDHEGNIVGAIQSMRDVTERRFAENALRMAHQNLEHLVARRTAELAQVNEELAQDIRQRQSAEDELRRRNIELTELNARLSQAQEQLIQSDKLASIGQLAAGVAHEINNPIGYIFSNFGTLQNYLEQLFRMLEAYQQAEAEAPPATAQRLGALRADMELDFLREDIPVLMNESREGIVRVRHIVQDLKDFSRVDTSQEWAWANLHAGIDSTLNIVANEVKYKADVVREYGDIPEVECLQSQINQVIMNLVVNAAHAIGPQRGKITLRTGTLDADHVWIDVEDNGSGIPKEHLTRIFDPFFTTKPIGKGTGLGLSLAYGIMQKHSGRIEVDTEIGRGTTFRLVLPIRQSKEP